VPDRLACFQRRGALATLALLLAPAISFAEADADWFARSWTTEDGLPNNTVHAIAQTPDGYLWLGSPGGVARFDGIRFEDFSPTNYIPLPNRGTVAMISSRYGGLWMALDRGGVVRLDSDATYASTTDLPYQIPNGLAEDGEGALWIAYRGGSLYRFKDRKATRITAQDGLPEGTDLCTVAADNRGSLWFAKAGQVGIFRAGKLQLLKQFEPAATRLRSQQSAATRPSVWPVPRTCTRRP